MAEVNMDTSNCKEDWRTDLWLPRAGIEWTWGGNYGLRWSKGTNFHL